MTDGNSAYSRERVGRIKPATPKSAGRVYAERRPLCSARQHCPGFDHHAVGGELELPHDSLRPRPVGACGAHEETEAAADHAVITACSRRRMHACRRYLSEESCARSSAQTRTGTTLLSDQRRWTSSPPQPEPLPPSPTSSHTTVTSREPVHRH
jgi:hypothetical protein